MEKEAERFNDGKPQLSYILEADYAIEGLTRVLEFGAAKYARSNYQASKMPAREIIDSLLRHTTKYLAGEELDDESGLPHADHVLANALFFAYHHNGRRDRARKGNFRATNPIEYVPVSPKVCRDTSFLGLMESPLNPTRRFVPKQ